jgi:predicted MFS family arabinose efflux permease
MSFLQAPSVSAGVPPEAPSLRRDWALFTALTFLFGFGFAVYAGVFQNFLREVQHAGPYRMGELESLREIPGLLTAMTAGTLVALAESRVGVLGILITAVGIGATGWMPGFWSLVAVTMFWSVGFHLWMSVSPAITLALAKGKEGGRHLGRMNAVGSAATLSALGLATVVAWLAPGKHYNAYFLIAGGSILAAAVLCSRLSTHAAGAPRARIILRREYGLYYLLTFLEGCRRQIFAIFASYALIAVYHVPLRGMLALQLVNAILIAITAPAMGRLIDRRGERGPLTFYSVALIVVFLGYATIPNLAVLYGLYLFDNVLFSFNVGFTTYLHRIVRPGEMTPCLAMGLTMNHVAAVTVPVSGAWLWQHSHNYQLPFWVGVAIACVSLIATRWLPRESGLPAAETAASATASASS